MIPLIVTALQILLLLLRAHFSKDEDAEKARAHITEAQAMLSEVAAEFEAKTRFNTIDPKAMDQFQDTLDKDIQYETHTHK